MKRIYELVMKEHLKKERQMLFLSGPRQVGKTTSSLKVSTDRTNYFYFNWDAQEDRSIIVQGGEAVAVAIGLDRFTSTMPIVVFDELHKYKKWKTFLKGFFDKYSKQIQIIVTESARLDIYRSGGDILMGRYFPYRLHPLSVAEIIQPVLIDSETAPISAKISNEDYEALFHFGGFPEPFIKRNESFYNRWKRLRLQQLFAEDLRDLTRIHEIGQIELLAELIRKQVGQLTSFSSFANKVNVTNVTVQNWIEILKSFYYCFVIRPWSKNITRSLLKEPKIYLWDWSFAEKEARAENFIASHLHKAVHFWTDRGFGDYGLYFLRDKEKREVDFLVTKDEKPWFLVEVKHSDKSALSKSLFHFYELTKAKHAFQISLNGDYQEGNYFSSSRPLIVSAKTFLSQLV